MLIPVLFACSVHSTRPHYTLPIFTTVITSCRTASRTERQGHCLPYTLTAQFIESLLLFSHRTDDMQYHQLVQSHPTPPPIATLHHSPALSSSSLGSSSISPSPPVRTHVKTHNSVVYRTRHLTPVKLSQPSTPYYQQHALAQAPSYSYTNGSSMSARYSSDGTAHSGSPYASNPPSATRPGRPTFMPSQTYPGQASYIVYTDDAATKLSDRVRRKCYNCRTTDTSTWRRSSLTPGKVVSFNFEVDALLKY